MKNNKGITLIALVITVIVMLILVSVVLKLIGQDGIIAKAKWSAYVTEYEAVDEAKEMYASSHIFDQYGDNSKIVTKEYQVATLENVGTTEAEQIIYPVNEKLDINSMVETLKNTIMQVENLGESDLTDLNKVNLYKIDFTKIDTKAKREYAVNLVSGMLYSIESEEHKGNIYHTPRLGVAKSTKITKVGKYEMIVDAGQTVSWDSVEIFYDKYIENSLTCKVYTSDDEIDWKEEAINLSNTEEQKEKYSITSSEHTQFLKVEIEIKDVDGENSEVDYILVNFYKYKDTEIEPEVTVEGAEQIDGTWTIPTPSNGETTATGTATVTQKVTIPNEAGEYILDIEETFGEPTTAITITKPDGSSETISVSDIKDLKNITVEPGSTIEITTTLQAGDGIGSVKVLKKEENLSQKKMENVINQNQEQNEEWITVKQRKYVYNNAGTGFWEKCLVNEKQVDETGILMESEDAVKRIQIRYQVSADGRSWGEYFSNIQDGANTQYLKVIVDYQVIEGNEYGDTSNNKIKVILNDSSWQVTFKDEDGKKLYHRRVYFTSSQLTGILELPNQGDKTGKVFAGWETEGSRYAVGTSYTVGKNMVFTATYIKQDIYTVEDLEAFRNAVNIGTSFEGKTIHLMEDLDLSSVCGEGIGSWVPIGNIADNSALYFGGHFEGNGHTISNIYINSNKTCQGLFGSVKNGAISNLIVQGNITSSAGTVGGMVGIIASAKSQLIENCINNVTTTGGSTVGGVVGQISNQSKNVTINNCTNNAEIKATSSDSPGGSVGIISTANVNIRNCLNTGNITAYNYAAAGIVGQIYGVSTVNLEYVSNTGAIKTNNIDVAGGIVSNVDGGAGKSYLTINCAHNSGSVYAKRYNVGGILGQSMNSAEATITNAYNEGTISAGSSSYGGIIGGVDKNAKGIVQYCHNIGTISGSNSYKGGIVGYQNAIYNGKANYWLSSCNATYGIGLKNTNTNATKYTADQMKVQSNFAGWDFDKIWKMDTAKGYPVLKNMPE